MTCLESISRALATNKPVGCRAGDAFPGITAATNKPVGRRKFPFSTGWHFDGSDFRAHRGVDLLVVRRRGGAVARGL